MGRANKGYQRASNRRPRPKTSSPTNCGFLDYLTRSTTAATVIVGHLDRLDRRTADLEQLLDFLDTRPARVKTHQGGGFDLNTHEGCLFARQLVAFSNNESAHKRDSVARAHQQRAALGLLYSGSHCGLRNDGVLHLAHSAVVRRIVEVYLIGVGVPSIARRLSQAEIPSPTGKHGLGVHDRARDPGQRPSPPTFPLTQRDVGARGHTPVESDLIRAQLFVEALLTDPSDFESVIEAEGVVRPGGYRVINLRAPSIPNALAALLLYVRDATDVPPISTSSGPRAARSPTSCGSCSSGPARSHPSPARSCAGRNRTGPGDSTCTPGSWPPPYTPGWLRRLDTHGLGSSPRRHG